MRLSWPSKRDNTSTTHRVFSDQAFAGQEVPDPRSTGGYWPWASVWWEVTCQHMLQLSPALTQASRSQSQWAKLEANALLNWSQQEAALCMSAKRSRHWSKHLKKPLISLPSLSQPQTLKVCFILNKECSHCQWNQLKSKVLLLVFLSLLLTAAVEIATETWLNQVRICSLIFHFRLFFSLKSRKKWHKETLHPVQIQVY